MGPRDRASQHLSQEQEYLVSALRKQGHLSVDDLMGQPVAPCIDACSVTESADNPQRNCHEGTESLKKRRWDRSHLRAHFAISMVSRKADQAVPPLDERHGRAHEPDHQEIHDQGLRVPGSGAVTGACPGLRSKLQLRKALEGAQVEDTIPGNLRGVGKRSKPL